MSIDRVPTEAIVCPFSKNLCKQCAAYRGRHFVLCASHSARLKGIRTAKAKAWNDHSFTKWEMPEIPDDTNIIADVENIVISRDFETHS